MLFIQTFSFNKVFKARGQLNIYHLRIASHSSFGGIPQNFKAIILYGKGTTIFLNSKRFTLFFLFLLVSLYNKP